MHRMVVHPMGTQVVVVIMMRGLIGLGRRASKCSISDRKKGKS